MALLEALHQEATRRLLWQPQDGTPDQPPGAPEIFFLVRDMPYGRASSRGPLITIREWRGTCSGKHYLLRALSAKSLGLPVNEEFVWGRDMVLACDPIIHHAVPEDGDPQVFKERLLRQSADAHDLARREAFIAAACKHGGAR